MYNLKYYHNRREALIRQLGGKCVMCGSTENLEFDHIDSSEKSFSIGTRIQNSMSNLQPELDKCQLLCHSCHIRKTKAFNDNGIIIDKKIANQICEEYATTNMTQKELGKKYGLKQSTVSNIIRGTRWTSETKEFDRNKISADKSMGSRRPKVTIDKIDPLTGEVICTYSSMSEAGRDGHTVSLISKCCNTNNLHHGYMWKTHKK